MAIVVDFAKGTSSNAPRRPIHLAHAAMMLIGWGILLPIGIMVARFTKKVKAGSKPPFWFQYHRIIQGTGLLFALIGFIIALSMVDSGEHFGNRHAKLGLATMIIGLLQPLNALIRPHPEPRTTMRLAWEILHKGLGYLVIIMAMAAIFLGMMQISPEASMAAKGIYAAWVAVLITVWFVMTIVTFIRDRNEPALPKTKADVEMSKAQKNPLQGALPLQ